RDGNVHDLDGLTQGTQHGPIAVLHATDDAGRQIGADAGAVEGAHPALQRLADPDGGGCFQPGGGVQDGIVRHWEDVTRGVEADALAWPPVGDVEVGGRDGHGDDVHGRLDAGASEGVAGERAGCQDAIEPTNDAGPVVARVVVVVEGRQVGE